jgi:hypothetical protein
MRDDFSLILSGPIGEDGKSLSARANPLRFIAMVAGAAHRRTTEKSGILET